MKYKGFIRVFRYFSPDSLRSQLLVRSFLILSILLLLVGAFQYFLMQNFLYMNTAQNMESQIRSIPHQVWHQFGNSLNENPIDPGSLFPLHDPNYSVNFIDTN